MGRIEHVRGANLTEIFSKTPRYLHGELQPRALMAGVGNFFGVARRMRCPIGTHHAASGAGEPAVATEGGAARVGFNVSHTLWAADLDPVFPRKSPRTVAEPVPAVIKDAWNWLTNGTPVKCTK